MGRYIGPACRLCRREGVKLFLKGDRCFSPKCAVEKRAYPPGQHGQGRKKVSPYALRLREKQKLRKIYGILETQFSNYMGKAERMEGMTGENLLGLLERRLDNVIFRIGLASSRNQARQLVLHGHFMVNQKKINVPSFTVRPGDKILIRDSSRDKVLLKSHLESASSKHIPSWIQMDVSKGEAQVVSLPKRDEIDVSVKENLVVEFYSR
ncbi:MAG: 30S ribosomal protein S4 [Firmicutes bacterium]|nr:30S ribosomal protein S4 [Bacillota bacterium]